jgi:predicted  nucleic acid-binding Zn-ribbon protein
MTNETAQIESKTERSTQLDNKMEELYSIKTKIEDEISNQEESIKHLSKKLAILEQQFDTKQNSDGEEL